MTAHRGGAENPRHRQMRHTDAPGSALAVGPRGLLNHPERVGAIWTHADASGEP